MTEAQNFVAALARARKSRKDIKPLVDAAYGDKSLNVSQINRTIKAVKPLLICVIPIRRRQGGQMLLWLLSPPPLRKTGGLRFVNLLPCMA
jgi:hypothetical protein